MKLSLLDLLVDESLGYKEGNNTCKLVSHFVVFVNHLWLIVAFSVGSSGSSE